MLKKIKENKVLRAIYNILYTILLILVIAILIVVTLQRVSNNNITIAGIRMFNIVTESMVPKYVVGDILISKSINPEDIKIGDDIVYVGKEGSFNGKIVTHQVIDIENENGVYKFHTKGIANEIEDPVVDQEQVYGKVIYKIYSLSFISKIINNLYAFYFVIFVPIVLLIFWEIVKIISRSREDDEDETEEEKNQMMKERNDKKGNWVRKNKN